VVRRYPARTEQVLLNRRGEPTVRSETINAKNNTWRILAIVGKDERTLVSSSSEFGDPPALLGLSADGRLIVPRIEGSDGASQLVAIDLKTGADTVFFSAGRFDVDGAVFDPNVHRVVGASWTDELETRQAFFDPDLQAAYDNVRAALPDGFARIVTWSRSRSRFLIHSEHAGYAGGAYFIFSPKTNALQLVGRLYPDVADRSTVQSISYPARDGVRVPAIITLPDQPASAKPPLVVLIHGGPAARDTAHFDWWARFLADRGYVVL
jgi:dipeptidyl aminopeptidase/acylaminoacyl peptidase